MTSIFQQYEQKTNKKKVNNEMDKSRILSFLKKGYLELQMYDSYFYSC